MKTKTSCQLYLVLLYIAIIVGIVTAWVLHSSAPAVALANTAWIAVVGVLALYLVSKYE